MKAINYIRKLMQAFFNWVGYRYGAKYLVNLNSGEVHVLGQIRKACNIARATKTKVMSEYDLKKYRITHPRVDGCRWCNFKNHNH